MKEERPSSLLILSTASPILDTIDYSYASKNAFSLLHCYDPIGMMIPNKAVVITTIFIFASNYTASDLGSHHEQASS